MKFFNLIFSLLLCFLFLITGGSYAQVPEQISFQGQLNDNTGTPAPDGDYSMRFSLFDSATGGTQLWNSPDGEEQSVRVTAGIYNVHLGAVEPLTTEIFNGGTVWLEIAIYNPDSEIWETMAPRMPVASVAYALKAGDADTLGGLESTDFSLKSHEHDTVYVNVGEANAVTSNMIADNAVTASEIAAGSVGAVALDKFAVETSAIADAAITSEKISDNAVNSSKIADYSIISNDFANGAVLASLRKEDGTGSLLDADMLDGHDGSYFAKAEHFHDSRYVDTAGDTMTGPLSIEDTLSVTKDLDVGGNLYVGSNSPDDDDTIYMDSRKEYLRWSESDNKFLLSNDLSVAGEYQYDAPKTAYLNLPAVAFTRTDSSNETWKISSAYGYILSGTASYQVQLAAPVQLPQGAVVTEFALYFFDNSATSNLSINGALGITNIPASTGTWVMTPWLNHSTVGADTAVQSVESSSIVSATIDNESRQYVISLTFSIDEPAGIDLRFYGARITYTLNRVSP